MKSSVDKLKSIYRPVVKMLGFSPESHLSTMETYENTG